MHLATPLTEFKGVQPSLDIGFAISATNIHVSFFVDLVVTASRTATVRQHVAMK